MKGYLFGFLLAVLVGSVAYGTATLLSRPKTVNTYTLLFADGTSTDIGAERYVIEGACVTFYKANKTLAFCNFPVIIDKRVEESAAPAPTPTNQEPPSGPTQLSPNSNLQAGN